MCKSWGMAVKDVRLYIITNCAYILDNGLIRIYLFLVYRSLHPTSTLKDTRDYQSQLAQPFRIDVNPITPHSETSGSSPHQHLKNTPYCQPQLTLTSHVDVNPIKLRSDTSSPHQHLKPEGTFCRSVATNPESLTLT